jgi:hypothetical protein
MRYQPLNEKFQSELTPGEIVIWTGQPSTDVIFHVRDLYLIPFSLLWGGFAIFWELSVFGYWGFPQETVRHPISWFFLLWGIPFVIVGQYMIWGRFLFDWWRKKRTFYAVTDKRLLIVEEVCGRKLTSVRLTENTFLGKSTRRDGKGTLRFGIPQATWNSWSYWGIFETDRRPSFRDIDEVERVYSIISGSQARREDAHRE